MYSLINAGLLENTVETRNRYLRKAEYRNTDWFKELFQNTVMHSHSVYHLVLRSPPTMRRSAPFSIRDGRDQRDFRYTANLNATYNISDALTLNLITNGSYRKQKAPGTLGATTDYVTAR